MKNLTFILCLLSPFLIPRNGIAETIGFEDLTTADNFTDLGIEDTYSGFQWGYGNLPGFAHAVFGPTDGTGWALATLSNPPLSPPPNGVGGNSFAWNSFGPQSLWINFEGTVDFTSGDFSTLSAGYSHDGSTVQLFGYDSAGALLTSSSELDLSDSMQTLDANMNGITYLEIVSAGPVNDSEFFAIDNLVVNPSSSVPDSGLVLPLLGSAFAVLAAGRHKFCRQFRESI